jgi:hypothetical protein
MGMMVCFYFYFLAIFLSVGDLVIRATAPETNKAIAGETNKRMGFFAICFSLLSPFITINSFGAALYPSKALLSSMAAQGMHVNRMVIFS